MELSKDADRLANPDTLYPVGPDTSGEIFYVRFPPLSPLDGACYFIILGLNVVPDTHTRHSNCHSHGLHRDRSIPLLLHLPNDPKAPQC
jgi:hypothetical protein